MPNDRKHNLTVAAAGLLFLLGIFFVYSLSANKQSAGTTTDISATASTTSDILYFAGLELTYSWSNKADKGDSIAYSGVQEDVIPVALAITRYNNPFNATTAAEMLLKQAEDRGDKIYSSFTAPGKDKADEFYIIHRALAYPDNKTATVFMSRVLESDGRAYSVIFGVQFEHGEQFDIEKIAEDWVLKNAESAGDALTRFELASVESKF